jgi:hypothetical protein
MNCAAALDCAVCSVHAIYFESGWSGFEQEAGVATGWPGQVPWGEPGPVHGSPWILIALREASQGVFFRSTTNQLMAELSRGYLTPLVDGGLEYGED